jgi:hypothetical protein
MKGQASAPVDEACPEKAAGARQRSRGAQRLLTAAGLLFVLSAAVGISIGVTWKVTRDSLSGPSDYDYTGAPSRKCRMLRCDSDSGCAGFARTPRLQRTRAGPDTR